MLGIFLNFKNYIKKTLSVAFLQHDKDLLINLGKIG